MRYVIAFFMAWGNFLTLPCPYKRWDGKLKNLMMVFVPLVGVIIGVLWMAIIWALRVLDMKYGLPDSVAALICTFYIFAICGFMHLDGFMDCNDAILSRRPLEDRQRILKDSTVGAFAVVMLGFLFMAWYASMTAIWDKAPLRMFFMLPVLSRLIASNDVLDYKPIGHSQYVENYEAKSERKRCKRYLGIYFVLIALAVVMGPELKSVVPMFAAAFTGILLGGVSGAYGRWQLGGMSGDIAGYEICCSEIFGVLGMAIAVNL